jgi:hypothetical protein
MMNPTLQNDGYVNYKHANLYYTMEAANIVVLVTMAIVMVP